MKNSEPIVFDYLQSWCPGIRYEATVGASNPDFSLENNGITLAFWDVADREFTDADQRELQDHCEASERGECLILAGRTKEIDFVKNKVRWKSEQFKKCGSCPGMLVLAEWAGAIHITGNDVSTVMEGWPQLRIESGNAGRVELVRSNDGRMNDPKVAQTNNHISAIGIVRQSNVQQHKSGLVSFETRVFERFGNTEHAWSLVNTERARLRGRGVDLEARTTYLEIFLNRKAHHPWPMELCGPFDRIFAVDPGVLEPTLIFDGLAPDFEIPIPLSQTQLDIDAIMKDQMFRAD